MDIFIVTWTRKNGDEAESFPYSSFEKAVEAASDFTGEPVRFKHVLDDQFAWRGGDSIVTMKVMTMDAPLEVESYGEDFSDL